MNVRHLFKLLATVYMMAVVSPSLAQVVGDGDIAVYPSDISARAQIFKTGFPAADNRVIRSDGVLGHVQGSDVELKDGGSMVFPVGTYIQVPSIKGGATSSVSATYGVTLPTGAYIQSGDVTGSLSIRFHNDTDTGIGTTAGGNIQIGRDAKYLYWTGAQFYPYQNGSIGSGSATFSWDDTYTDDLYLQLTTAASEGKLHWEGAAGDASMALVPVKADGTAPSAAADAVALSVKLAASPGSGESVEQLRITTTLGLVVNANGAGNAAWLTSDEDSTDYLQWLNTSTPWSFAANNARVVTFGTGGVNSYNIIGVGWNGSGSTAKYYLANVAGNNGSSIQSRSSAGTEVVPYDSVSVFLPGSPALPSSVEQMRVTTTLGLVLNADGAGEWLTSDADSTDKLAWVSETTPWAFYVNNSITLGINATAGTLNYQELNVDYGGSGTEAEINFSGAADTAAAAKIEMSDSSGAASAPYDSFSFKLSDMGAPASIEAMRITSATVYIPKGLRHGADTTLTIVSDAVTVTQVEHALAGEGSNDDTLATINGGVEGDMVVFRVAADEKIDLVETGNIIVPGASIELTGSSYDRVTLRFDGAKWVCVAFSDNT